jgi:hypothetical protein
MSEISVSADQSFVDRIFPPTWKQIAFVAVALLALVALVVTLEGAWTAFWQEGIWSRLLTRPTVIVYILIVSKLLQPFLRRAADSLRSISGLDDQAYQQLVLETHEKTSKGAAPALVAGFAFGFLASVPEALSEGFNWVNWYFPFMQGLMFGMVALILQQSLSESHLTNQLLQGPLDFDIFYTTPFLPIGMVSLVVALAFLGGSTIVVFFKALGSQAFTWFDLIIHGILILMTLLIFFLTMRQTHRVLRPAKVSELNNIRQKLAGAYRRLDAMTLEEKQNILPFSQEINLWVQYKEELKAVPTWPYNASMLRTLFVSILIPIFVTVGQRVMAYVLVEIGIK